VRRFGDKFLGGCLRFLREIKGRCERGFWGIYGRPGVRRGLGFSGAGRDRWRRELPCRERREGLDEEDDVWGRAVRKREGAVRYHFGFWLAGLRARSMAGPNGSPEAFYSFSIFFSLF
jgi:hypothetical protein